jgi:hypothetical protein
MSEENKFYVYKHRFSNGRTYIGKGVNDRCYDFRNRSEFWKRNLCKYGDPTVEVVLDGLSEEQAFELEEFLIVECIDSGYSLGGTLINLTLGGEGISGYVHTEESKKTISLAVKNYWSSFMCEDHKECLREKRKAYNQAYGNPGRSHDPEVKEKLSAAGKAYYATHTHNSKGKKLSEEHKKAIGEGLKGNIHPESTKEKIRNTHRANATKHKGFVPWWYEVGGVRTEVVDKTIAQFAEEQKVAFHIVKDRFKKQYQGKARQSEPLKGYTFGRITK